MIDGVIVETAASPDNIAQIVKAIEEAKADFIKTAREDVPTGLIDDPAIYKFLVNPRNYPSSQELLKKAAAVYVGFVLEEANNAAKNLPPERVKAALLHTLQTGNLSKATVFDFSHILMKNYFGDYLSRKGDGANL